MNMVRQVPSAEILRRELSLTEKQKENRLKFISEIQAVLAGKSKRKILCIGPCSADNEKAVLEYMTKLADINRKVKDKILIIPRVYTSKPRTTGTGYKGLLHRPQTGEETDNIYEGIRATRAMHLHVVQETDFFCADEMLYPEAFYYISDLLSYTAVGARSVENQQHRLVSSGLEMPVGMKNPTSGDIDVMLNAITAAQNPQSLLYHGWECRTDGNGYAHGILRGYIDGSGLMRTNYHYETLCEIYDHYIKRNLKNVSAIIDCNHNNSGKHYDEQVRIAREVIFNCKNNGSLNKFIKGLMIESYLEDGAQMVGGGIYGKSITDPCLGWKKTERLIFELGELL